MSARKGPPLYRCACSKTFEAQVWHCPACHRHWPAREDACPSCHGAERPAVKAAGWARPV